MSSHARKGTATLISGDILSRLERWYQMVREGLRISASMRDQAPKSRREG